MTDQEEQDPEAFAGEPVPDPWDGLPATPPIVEESTAEPDDEDDEDDEEEDSNG